MLLQAKAPIQARNTKNGHVPLHEAALYGSLVSIKLLLEHFAPLMPRTNSGKLPVELAEEMKHTDIVAYMNDYINNYNETGSSDKHIWFHGTLCRSESIKRMKKRLVELNLENGLRGNILFSPYETGIFLVRISPNQKNKKTISLLHENEDNHFLIEEKMVSNYLIILLNFQILFKIVFYGLQCVKGNQSFNLRPKNI